jgi:aldehyde dehydrogenase (NAD(P)+)
MTLLPKPPWFITNKKAGKLGMLLTRFQYRPGFLKIPRIFLNALLG